MLQTPLYPAAFGVPMGVTPMGTEGLGARSTMCCVPPLGCHRRAAAPVPVGPQGADLCAAGLRPQSATSPNASCPWHGSGGRPKPSSHGGGGRFGAQAHPRSTTVRLAATRRGRPQQSPGGPVLVRHHRSDMGGVCRVLRGTGAKRALLPQLRCHRQHKSPADGPRAALCPQREPSEAGPGARIRSAEKKPAALLQAHSHGINNRSRPSGRGKGAKSAATNAPDPTSCHTKQSSCCPGCRRRFGFYFFLFSCFLI